ncbi:hypothetical protein JCM19992_29100 [Thermostilla marina]
MIAFVAMAAVCGVGAAACADDSMPVVVVQAPAGWSSTIDVPVSAEIDLPLDADRCPEGLGTWPLGMVEVDSQGRPISDRILPAQFVPKRDSNERSAAVGGGTKGTLWWLVPPVGDSNKAKQPRRFRVVEYESPAMVRIQETDAGAFRFVQQAGDAATPLLQYNWAPVPVPEGVPPHFAPGQSYKRGDYIHPLYGPGGRILTDDYPLDHPHHRGIWWTWPVVRWNDRVGDIWAVVDVWAFPLAKDRVISGPVFAELALTNVWKFGAEKTPIVRESVAIRAFRRSPQGEGLLDVEVRLQALTEGVAIGGRPKGGYGGFSLRAAPAEGQTITPFVDPEDASVRRSWLDYVANFDGRGPAGITLVEHPANPGYPNPWYEYPNLNCVMPAWPEEREIAVPQDEPLVLRYRVWIHPGVTNAVACEDVWRSVAAPPSCRMEVGH